MNILPLASCALCGRPTARHCAYCRQPVCKRCRIMRAGRAYCSARHRDSDLGITRIIKRLERSLT